jgi:FkbM family methyltransferase
MLVHALRPVRMGALMNHSEEIELRYGDVHLVCPRESCEVYFTTCVLGEYERLRLRRGDIVLDAGANIGDFTVLAAEAVGPEGLVVSIEPSARAFGFLQNNIKRNGLTNVKAVRWFVSGEIGSVPIVENRTYAELATSPDRATSTVPAGPIDDLLRLLGVDHVTVAKIDIEGMEATAIAGQRYLQSTRELAIEVHSLELERDIRARLTALGFSIQGSSGAKDFARLGIRAVAHPLDLLHAEIATNAFATRRIALHLLGRSSLARFEVGSGVRLLFARRSDGPRAPG